MATTEEYIKKIKDFKKDDLLKLWKDILNKNTPDWEKGKALEFLILRAFELEGSKIRWPYTVNLFGENVEQIDGVIHLNGSELSVIIECKDLHSNVNIEPIAKVRNQLLRRPVKTIGAIFTGKEFTDSALILAQFVAPQTILLWERNHIEYCLKNTSFNKGMLLKYRHAIEEGFPNFDITTIPSKA